MNGEYRTLGNLQRLNFDDKDYLIQYLTGLLELQSDEYKNRPIKAIILSYGIRDGKSNIVNNIFSQVEFIKTHLHSKYKLPITMDPFKFGHILSQARNQTSDNLLFFIQISKQKTAIIECFLEENQTFNQVKIIENGQIILEFKDLKIDESQFIREIGQNKYYFENGELTLETITKKGKFIDKLKTSTTLNDKMITFDIETKLVNNQHIPYAVSIFINDNLKKSFYLADFINPQEMLKTALLSILIKKYKNYHIYMHNFAKFDGVFLLNILAKLGNIKIIRHKGRLISISLKYKNYVIHFKDSYQILPSSLRKLAKSFGVEQKSIFPYSFVNQENISLNYIGNVPEFNFFDNITLEEYQNYNNLFNNKPWSLGDEIIKYCEIDVKALYEVLTEFNHIIYNLFQLNINNYPTLPSLAFAIFRSNFMKENSISQLSGKIFKDIKNSYTGGSVDVYVPENSENDFIYVYDYNSLYPAMMNNNEMPIGIPTYFEGDIRKIDPEAFGFFYCKIKCPKDLKYPVLQTHVNTPNGIRTMAALGEYEDMLFSKEMDNAKQFGYEFEILWGYTFERDNIFSDFIQFLYKLRLNYPKSHPMNLIAKLIMNSLYGRFGMDDSFSKFVIIKNKDYHKWENKNIDSIIDVTIINDEYLVETKSPNQEMNTMLDNGSENHNINIAIASAITSYARIHMSQTIKYLIDNGYILYYKDTDSLFINKPLPDHLVSNTELGKLKLEYICTKGIFLAPKVYCLITIDNQFICKVKGLDTKNINLTLEDFKYLLYKDSKLEKSHMKWFKSFEAGTITVKEQLYTLKVTSNKRRLIYQDDIFVDTEPYIINNNKKIKIFKY
uniref:DNA polymerase n=1 Tax=Pappia fissilis TaxID=1040649 RepID=UPI002A7F7EB4|nr:DNA polymerase [Pappia fissilis]WOX61288.1 DNA polymerase [Pappia fissilis]